jgi:phage terminase small subunit
MSKRKIDPETGGPALTWRENNMVEGFVANGGNATRAAIDAGYSPNHASQAAWNVLNRPAVQERIHARIAQAQAEPDEAIGSLVSQMRADVTDCFGPDGAFSVELARQNGLGHLLKVSTTIHRKAGHDGCLLTTGDATRIEFLSPQTAALQLARINAAASGAGSTGQKQPPVTVERTVAVIQKVIERTLEQFPGMTREEVLKIIRDFRPEAAKYFHLLPQPQEAVLKIDESR